MKQFDARAFERELVDAGYMPMSEYVRRWGDEALSSAARIEAKRVLADFFLHGVARAYANAPQPEANTGERADD
jgi:hypothetical protein